MNVEGTLDLEIARRATQLQTWVDDCKKRMYELWPEINFDSTHWPLHSLYQTKLLDVSLASALADFEGKDPAYGQALRCLLAEIAFAGKLKISHAPMLGWRLLSRIDVPLHQLRRSDLLVLEKALVTEAQSSIQKASTHYRDVLSLRAQIDQVGIKGATERLAWTPSPETKTELLALQGKSSTEFRASKAAILDRQIEALSDAHTAMFQDDARLSAYDRVALALMGLNMCCPNRINEPLCMSLDDRFTLEDYQTREAGSNAGIDDPPLARVHQMLLVKGSKGASWGAKPILNFMISFADLCFQVIKKHGERSRRLVTWYEEHPDTLYLPSELEHLRGAAIDRRSLWQIMNLQSREPTRSEITVVGNLWPELRSRGFVKSIDKPKTLSGNSRKATVQVCAWSNLEPFLIARVKLAMDETRRVTVHNHYQGRLSNMLVLFDSGQVPYLPSSIKYNSLKLRLRQSACAKNRYGNQRYKSDAEPTLFEKLGLKMVVNGIVEVAYIDTHDPRRWLTTQALDSGLPDLLTNKWANRLDINQLKAYDLRTPERKAQQASMPEVSELNSMTEGLRKIGALEADFGLRTEVVVIGDANIAVTSMDEVMRATENRPIARTANQIIILYPQRYGVCLHQHHERPCRSYRCAPCNEGVVVKGHLPTNERLREDCRLVFTSIVNQLEALLIARHRQLSDAPATLDEHILSLVRDGLKPEEMAKDLITRFHEINDQIKDRAFANKLSEAFALSGYVEQLDKVSTPSGALIKYLNPSYHAAPGHERALDAVHGGRAGVKAKVEAFDKEYPQFGKSALGKLDQRELLEAHPDDDQEALDE